DRVRRKSPANPGTRRLLPTHHDPLPAGGRQPGLPGSPRRQEHPRRGRSRALTSYSADTGQLRAEPAGYADWIVTALSVKIGPRHSGARGRPMASTREWFETVEEARRRARRRLPRPVYMALV